MKSLLNVVYVTAMLIAASAAMGVEPEMEHEHKMVQMPDGTIEPTLQLQLYKDAKSGFNLHIQASNFELEPPQSAGGAEGRNILEGHAHIFINGKKVYRAYSEHIHLPIELFGDGLQQIMVSLNDHDHNTWSKGSRMVMSTLVVNPSQEQFIVHRFDAYSAR